MGDLRCGLISIFIPFHDKFAINNARNIEAKDADSARRIRRSRHRHSRFVKRRLTRRTVRFSLSRALFLSLQLSVACKSTSCRPFAASGSRARNLYCPKHASRRFTLANASTDEGHPALHAHTRSYKVESHGNALLDRVRSASLILWDRFATARLSHPTRMWISVRPGQYTRVLFRTSPICPVARWTTRWESDDRRNVHFRSLIAHICCNAGARSETGSDQSLRLMRLSKTRLNTRYETTIADDSYELSTTGQSSADIDRRW